MGDDEIGVSSVKTTPKQEDKSGGKKNFAAMNGAFQQLFGNIGGGNSAPKKDATPVQPKPQTQPVSTPVSTPKPTTQTQPNISKPQSQSTPTPTTQPKPQSQPISQPQSNPQFKAQSVPQPVPTPKPQTQPMAKPQQQPQPEQQAKPIVQPFPTAVKPPEEKKPVAAPKPPVATVSAPVKKQPATNQPTNTSGLATTNFFKRFRKSDPKMQAQYTQAVPKMNEILCKIASAKEVLLVVGSTGLYTQDDIYQEGINQGYWDDTTTSKNRISRVIPQLAGKNGQHPFLIEGGSELPTGKGRAKKSYLLSPMGEAWYALTTKLDPIKSLSIVRAKEQKSVAHAELIQRMIKILKDSGYETYQEVPMPTKTTGEYSIADISANKGQHLNLRIECEMGNYDTPSYIYKFQKALEVSNRLLVGVPTQPVKAKITDAIHELIREHYKGIDNFAKAGKFFKVFILLFE